MLALVASESRPCTGHLKGRPNQKPCDSVLRILMRKRGRRAADRSFATRTNHRDKKRACLQFRFSICWAASQKLSAEAPTSHRAIPSRTFVTARAPDGRSLRILQKNGRRSLDLAAASTRRLLFHFRLRG